MIVLVRLQRHFCSANPASRMKAWQMYSYGGIRQLLLSQDYQTPFICHPNQVIVQVHAASVNPIDVLIADGYGSSIFSIVKKCIGINEFPITLGRDFSGTVVKVGRSVRQIRPGTEVIGALWPFEQGSHANYVVCCESQLAVKPKSISHEEAAALPYAGLTAYSSLVDIGGLKAGNADEKRILILGSSGGVGTVALQLAKSWGAHVTVTGRSGSKELLSKLGADCVYSSSTAIADTKFDIIFDCIGDDFSSYSQFLKPASCSRYITLKHSLIRLADQYSPPIGLSLAGFDFSKNFVCNAIRSKGGIYQWGFFRASGSNLSVLSELVDRGLLKSVIHNQYNLCNGMAAYEEMQSGNVTGKIIINVSGTN